MTIVQVRYVLEVARCLNISHAAKHLFVTQSALSQQIARLEEIVDLLEKGDAPLEQAMALFEEGAGLLRECTARLDQAEQKVTLLTVDREGQEHETEFQGEE